MRLSKVGIPIRMTAFMDSGFLASLGPGITSPRARRINQLSSAFDDAFRRRIGLCQHFGNLAAGHRLDFQLRLCRLGDELGIGERLLERLTQRCDR